MCLAGPVRPMQVCLRHAGAAPEGHDGRYAEPTGNTISIELFKDDLSTRCAIGNGSTVPTM
jgi:hypothetical protein